MVIPGAKAQIPLIKSIKKQGYSVVCVNPYEDSPAFEYADYSEQYDIMDVENCIKVAKRYNVCAVISDECDIAMPSLAKISEALGLPSISSELAKLYTNKEMMREFSEKNGFPYTPYKQCVNLDEAKSFFNSLKSGKMIIKPLDSNSSRGVYTVTSEQELNDYFNESLSYSHSVKAVLCEEFIEGTEFTIDGVVINGKHYCLAISEKDHTTSSFLRWFVDEQSEEEENMEKVVRKLRLLKNDPAGLLMIDQELAQRTYVPIAPNA